ncbi:MAG TPA: hypothetical protein VN688_32385 [Gemmataceae bacterium]|nr:hypothetical protein [Gemmataceae bacterium]
MGVPFKLSACPSRDHQGAEGDFPTLTVAVRFVRLLEQRHREGVSAGQGD